MTRFDASKSTERRRLFVDAIVAHRERASEFITIEVDEESLTVETDGEREPDVDSDSHGNVRNETETTGDSDIDSLSDITAHSSVTPDPSLGVPWIQFSDGMCNLDCTADELERLKSLLNDFPAFKITELNRFEETNGINVRISAKADPNRIAQFIDAAFRSLYGLDAAYKAWVVEI